MVNWFLIILNRYKIYFLILCFLLVVILSYSRVVFIFFQQDEFFMFGDFIKLGWKAVFTTGSLHNLAHFIPVSLSLSYGIYSLFGLNNIAFNCFGVFIHLLNGLLVYKLAKIIFKKSNLSILSAILFFSCSRASELVMWPVASLNTLSLTFILTGWLYFFHKAESNVNFKIIDGVMVSVLFLLAVFVIEYSVMFALFFPFLVLLNNKISKKSLVKLLTPFILITVCYFFLRFSSSATITTAASSVNIYETLVFLPFVYISQLFFGQDVLIYLSKSLSSDPFVIVNEVYKYVSGGIGVLIYLGLFFTMIKIRYINRAFGNYLATLTLFIFLSSLPFVTVLGGIDASWIIPSRYFYFGTVGYALVITSLLVLVLNKRKIALYIWGTVVVALVAYGTYSNYLKSKYLFNQGNIRLKILNQIKKAYPELSKKTVFYFLSDTSYYGLSDNERILPFQSGLGQTLLVWYAKSENFPDAFLSNRFLWDITSQDYKENEGVGFGYFRDFEKMTDSLKTNNLPSSAVIAFRYDSESNTIEDITGEVRGSVNGVFTNKRVLNSNSIILTSPLNNQNIYLAEDNNRKTYWDSKLPYKFDQYVEIYFNKVTKIAQIQIDSYNNKDQNQVGYRILLLGTDQVWHQVFYAKRYPPDDRGLVNLYFQPQMALGVRMEQVGYHSYATWVIHELKIYEAIN